MAGFIAIFVLDENTTTRGSYKSTHKYHESKNPLLLSNDKNDSEFRE